MAWRGVASCVASAWRRRGVSVEWRRRIVAWRRVEHKHGGVVVAWRGVVGGCVAWRGWLVSCGGVAAGVASRRVAWRRVASRGVAWRTSSALRGVASGVAWRRGVAQRGVGGVAGRVGLVVGWLVVV
ncbi:hypothetical protein ACXZ9C_11335 [Streptococcus agalactiae]